MQRYLHQCLSFVLSLSLVVTTLPISSRQAAARELSRAEYEACQARDDDALKKAVAQITTQSLAKGLEIINYQAVVDAQWHRIGMNRLIDNRVDLAIVEVRKETSWAELLKSLAYKDVSQKLAVTVTERVYRSEVVKTALDTLAVGVGKDVARNLEIATIDSAKPALACIKAYLGPRYGTTVAGVVSQDAGKAFNLDPATGKAIVGKGAIAAQSSAGIAGAVIILVRRRLGNMAARLGQRLVGSVLGRLVSIVAGGVGVALIAKDLWDLRTGVLPIIAKEMKSRTTKEKVKAEIARTIAAQIKMQSNEIAAATADSVVKVWREFRRGHAKVLELSERNKAFRQFLNTTRARDLGRLDEVVALLLPVEKEAGVLRRLKDGTLQRAVTELSEQGMIIAREKQSLELAIRWSALAGSDLRRVTEYDLHKRADPGDFSKASLKRLFGLNDDISIRRLAGISREARESLFDLNDKNLMRLTRSMGSAELETLSGYLTGLAPGPRKDVLKAVAETPARMRVLASVRVRDAVLSSKDQSAAVRMMLLSPPVFDINTLRRHSNLVLEGRVSPVLMWEKHPIALVAAVISLLFLLLVLRRLLFARRRV